MRTVLHKLSLSPLWISFRDIVAYSLFIVIVGIVHDLRRGENPFIWTLKDIKIAAIIFAVTWVAVYIGCRMGVTTITNGWDGNPWGREGIPAQIILHVDHALGNHLYIEGSLQRQNRPDIIKGEIVWLPNLNIFRGHVLVNPPSGDELLCQDIEQFKKLLWTKMRWQRSEYSNNNHDHCAICVQSIYETDDETVGTGYFSGGHWLCKKCYEKFIKTKRN